MVARFLEALLPIADALCSWTALALVVAKAFFNKPVPTHMFGFNRERQEIDRRMMLKTLKEIVFSQRQGLYKNHADSQKGNIGDSTMGSPQKTAY